MTQKELLYLEDAIMHEDNIIKIITNHIDSLDEDELVTFMNEEIEVHTALRDKLINLLEESINE